MNAKSLWLGSLLLGMILPCFAQKKYSLSSPDKTIQVSISIGDSITYAVSLDGKALLTAAPIAFQTSADKNAQWKVSKALTTAKDELLKPVVQQKTAELRDQYNQLHVDFANGLSLEWRAYDNGIAWHWITNHQTAYTVLKEQALFGLEAHGRAWYPQEDGFFSHNERQYRNYRIDSIDDKKLASLPALFESQGAKLLITESSLFNYAGMWLRGKGNGQLQAVFPHYPKEKKVTSDRDERVNSREDFIARVSGPQAFPWRIVMIARTDAAILTNQLPYQLGRPATGDYSWVKPGKVQWDWWHYNNIYGVDFRAGINNDTYKYYIDFAAKYGIEYVLLDEGWCDTRDLMKQAPGINVEELARYAREKKVDLLLWTSWLVLDKQLDTALKVFAQWGIKGIKVDFMQRDDQDMVNYYEKVSKAAAAHHMLVDFHGAYKPTGWLRTYPNVMTSEGVLGNEISKFAGSIDPEHTTTIPFTRMAAGPMDFTPGGMLNAQKNAWAAVPGEPLTLGTRCNQLAMYVIYESPLQMLCDMPTHYYREPEAMEFLRAVPSVWTNTVPLQAKVGDYVAIARQAANGDWFVGAMTDWTPRDLALDLSFLPEGKWRMQVWKDGPNADRNAKDCAVETTTVDRTSKLIMKLAKGGGYVARIVRL
ncbi:glycoside hydrolase family 97 protein [Paraflavitalea soli]|uniref:Glycoside hydrolase family 97 protein n=1 Tax=Paraflavitalea soli TaxID=2315862 RepID=A0A3B7MT10_9BACT|nr:glycoside hydrolase family 97 protein [Paraflavitalea soli]AXY74775.1 glycoside hydrolase family 97 protein [Paraflavitalea soli]